MALTNWNDILNKPKGIDEVPEIALTVEQLSASVLSISEDVGEIALDVSQLSASVLSIGGDISDIETAINKFKIFDKGSVAVSSSKVIDLSSVSMKLMLLIISDNAYVVYVRGASIIVTPLATSATYNANVTTTEKEITIVNGSVADIQYDIIYMD